MKRLAADLHIHTALSPCGDPEMTPRRIVRAALERGLALIAICDHNSAGNTRAVQAAAGARLGVIAGIELTTAEEVHMVSLFPDCARALALGGVLRQRLPERRPEHAAVGGQLLLDARDRVIGRETRLLAAATPFPLAEAVRLIRAHDGLAVAAHVDRPSFGVLGQLGFFPRDLDVDAIELTAGAARAARDADYSALGVPVVTASDSHSLGEIGSAVTWFRMAAPTFAELALALRGRAGRSCCHV